MAKIEPFASITYNPDVVQDVAHTACPPYDIIDSRAQEEFYQKHPYNIIRMILGKDLSGDTPTENKYARAAEYLAEWLRRGILAQDQRPCLYFYEQEFQIDGRTKKRLGFIGLMRLESEGEARSVYPHELTHEAPKEDRLRLIKAVEANLSPIFTVFSDPGRFLRNLFEERVLPQDPFFTSQDAEGVRHRMWRASDEDMIAKVKNFMSDKETFVADGHHRLEVARMFKDFKRQTDPAHFKDSYNFIMTYFTPLEDEGLIIFPTHRLIKGASFSADSLAPFFRVTEMPTKDALVARMEESRDQVGAFGLYKEGKFSFFKVADKTACNRCIQDGPRAYRDLDVVLLHKVVLDRLLKIGLGQISYEVDLERAIRLVDEKHFDALFVLNPTKMDQVREIALGGSVLPQKSTYFYPKLLSGLVIHKF